MIPLLHVALMVRAGRRLDQGQVNLVSRPHGVVHVTTSPLTPSGRFIPVAGRTACHAHTRRLSVIGRRSPGSIPDIGQRRVCARCLLTLARQTGVPGLRGETLTRDQEIEVFDLLGPDQDQRVTLTRLAALTDIAARLVSVDEAHELGRLTRLLHGLRPAQPLGRRTPVQQALVELFDLINHRRQVLTVAEMTLDDRDALQRAKDAETQNLLQVQANRHREVARDRAVDRRNRGQYLTKRERELISA